MAVAENVPSLEVQIVGLYVLRGMSPCARNFFVAGFEREGAHDAAVDLVLKRQQVLRDAWKFLAPKPVS